MRLPRNVVKAMIVLGVLSCVGLPPAGAQDDSTRVSRPPTPPAGWTDGFVMANGIRIHYWRTGGDKPVLLMAHGSSDDGLCWTNLAKELVDDYDIILPDARGHGLSDPPQRSDAADAQAEDLAGLIRVLKLEKPILMGHSMGSSSVAWCSAKYPDIPGAVILEDPRLLPRPLGGSRSTDSAAVAAAQEKRRTHILARNNTPYETLVAQCVKNNPQWGRSECEYWAPSKRLHHPDTAFRSRSGRPPMSELFPKITAPTLILKADARGDERKKNEAVAELLKHGKIVHVEGARHNVRRDQKARLLKALREFLGATITSVPAREASLIDTDNQLSAEDQAFLDRIQRKAFDYFWDGFDPVTGLIADKDRGRRTSVANSGFGLSAFCIGVDRGWKTRQEVYDRVIWLFRLVQSSSRMV